MVEDISDEEFEVEKAQQLGRNDIAKNGAVNHSLLRNSSSHAAQGKNAPPTAICADSQKMHLSEDPIEDFSGERTLSSPRQMPGQDLLASPVKNKRNTARTARNHPSPHNIGVSNQTEVKRDALVGQELGTTDLILEGLMTENSKKHKSLHKEDASDRAQAERITQKLATKLLYSQNSLVKCPTWVKRLATLQVIAAVTQLCHLKILFLRKAFKVNTV